VTAAYSYTNSTGSGSLESARGSAHLVDNGVVLNGEKDIFGSAVSTSTLASKRTAGTAWTGGTYNGQVWTGSGFSGTDWTAATWSGRMWSGDGWSGNTWSSAGWN
jgi:serine protease AprX